MEMEVVMPAVMDFNFDSNCSSPYMTAPSSPQRFGNGSFFFSAPASPTRISPFHGDLNDHSVATSNEQVDEEEDFEFNFSGQLERVSLSAADELFDGGKIRPLKPLTGKDPIHPSFYPEKADQQRGRERVLSESCSRKGTRSLSPIRVSDIIDDQVNNSQAARITITSKRCNDSCYEINSESSGDLTRVTGGNNDNNSTSKSYASSILSAISFTNKKWKLKDLLLFRSASEGRATSPDPLRKYAMLSKKETIIDHDDVKNSSFRSTESSGSVSLRRQRVALSAHELHYTANRAVSEELKRKTFLPYKQGLLGCLGFNPSGMHDISRVGSLPRG